MPRVHRTFEVVTYTDNSPEQLRLNPEKRKNDKKHRPRDLTASLTVQDSDAKTTPLIEDALTQVGIQETGKLVEHILSSVKKALPDQSLTINFMAGRRKQLEVRAYKGKLYLTAPSPPPPPEVAPDPVPPPVVRRTNLTVRNKTLLMENSRLLISVLTQALDYKHQRGTNYPPPDLWMDDATYLEDVGHLVHELKRLNDLLEKRASKAARTKSTIDLGNSAGKFIDSYAETMGKHAAGLTAVGLLAMTLYLAGFSVETVAKFYSILK